MVRAKKHLGQHFLIDKNICVKIANSLKNPNGLQVVEIGPGTGVLTDPLTKRFRSIVLVEIDEESVEYLKHNFEEGLFEIIQADFLKLNLATLFSSKQFCVIGNFPYNISSQILFKILENKVLIPEVVCMVQKEMADRVLSKHGSKTYGILSVLIQLFFKTEYLFTVNETVFHPQPKVKSAVIRLERYRDNIANINEEKLFLLVKTAFNQRRKVLRNSLKSIITINSNTNHKFFAMRPEQLSPEDFLELLNNI